MYWMARAVGPGNLPRRIWHAMKGKLGIHRLRLPGGELPTERLRKQFIDTYEPPRAVDHWRERASKFFVCPERLAAVTAALRELVDDERWDRQVHDVVESLRQGRMRFFGRFFVDTGWPVTFNRDPVNKVDWPTGRHWSTYDQFDPHLSDMKCVWEASRFSNAYLLARDYARSRHSDSAELFWQMFDDWDRQNPHGLTVQWACGQEGSFRVMAWLFAAIVMLDEPAASAQRLHRLTELIWYTGRHIDRNIDYARGQKNNHAISEAVVLWTIGVLFPELRHAPEWRRKGRRILATEVRRQIYDDGSYVQHSLNYHRLMLDDLLWALRLAELHDAPLPHSVADRFERALNWMLQMVDPVSGCVPNYGANDGALVLPLSCSDYVDFRPIVQAAHYLLHRKRCFSRGPWDEKALWLFGTKVLESSVDSPQRQPDFAAPIGGYYIQRGPRSWAMTRCHSYCDRPGQADMLHVDLWMGGENILRDGGSYRYYCDQPWQRYFSSTAAHNTIEIDRVDQMTKGPRFLWFRWTRSQVRRIAASDDGRVGYFEGEHYGYLRLPGRVIHRRCLCRIDDTYIIVDDILGKRAHEVCLCWRLHPSDWQNDGDGWLANIAGTSVSLKVFTPKTLNLRLVMGETVGRPEGWESLYYGEMEPVPTLIARGSVTLPVRLVTVVGPTGAAPSLVAGDRTFEPDAPLHLAGIEYPSDVARLSCGKIRFQ